MKAAAGTMPDACPDACLETPTSHYFLPDGLPIGLPLAIESLISLFTPCLSHTQVLPKDVIPHTRHVRGSNFCFMNVFEVGRITR